MYEPRGHPAMSGAILQPPTRPDCDCGVLFIEVSGCLPMCGHGTIGVATVLVETGMVAVTEPVTTIRLDTPAGLVVAEVAVEDGAARGDDPQRGLVRAGPRPAGRGRRGWARGLRHGLRRQLLRHGRAGQARLRLRPRPAAGHRRGRAGHHGGHQHRKLPVHPTERGHHRLPPRAVRRRRLHRPAFPARHGDLPGLVRPLAVRHRHQRADGAAARPRRAGAGHRVRQRVLHRHAVHRPAGRGDSVGELPAVMPTITGRAWVTGTAQYLLDPTDPFPAGFRF